MEYVVWIVALSGALALVLAITIFITRYKSEWRDAASLTAVAVLVGTLVAAGVLYAVGPEEVRDLTWPPLAVALIVIVGGGAWWRGIRWALPLVTAPIFLFALISAVSIAWVLMDTNERFIVALLLGSSLAAGLLGWRGRSRS